MTAVRHVRIGAPDIDAVAADALRAALGPTSPSAVIEVVRAPKGIQVDGVALRLTRAPWPTAPDALAHAVAWPLFFHLVERRPAGAAPATVASLGPFAASHLDWLADRFGLLLDVPAERPLSENGPRLVVDEVLSPPLDPDGDDRRGAHTARGVLRRLAARLVGERDAVRLLDTVELHRPWVARTMRERFPIVLLTDVLRILADGSVPLHHPRLLCESMLAVNRTLSPHLDTDYIVFVPAAVGVAWTHDVLPDLPAPVWAECVRAGLKPLNTSAHSEQVLDFDDSSTETMGLYLAKWRMSVGLLDRTLERRIREDALSDAEVDEVLDRIAQELSVVATKHPVPILTTSATGHSVWKLTRDALPDVPVLSYQELSPEVNIDVLFRVDT